MAAEDFIITRKRKRYRFAKFAEATNCYEVAKGLLDAQKAPLTLEIGAGTGLFSVQLAALCPERFFVAADVKADRLQKGAWQALDQHLPNVIFVRSHAYQLPEFVPPHSLATLWVTFPDPHPKRRSAQQRLLHQNFLQVYRNLLRLDGELLFKTDDRALFDWSLEQLKGMGWQLRNLSNDLHASDLADEYKLKTTYEEKFLTEGRPINFVRAICN